MGFSLGIINLEVAFRGAECNCPFPEGRVVCEHRFPREEDSEEESLCL